MDDQDILKVRARGPWVLVKPEEPPKTSSGGLYFPDGNLLERLGHLVGRVISASPGYWERKKKDAKEKFVSLEVKPGDRVVFRGHLKGAQRLGPDHCFMHAGDLVGVLEEDARLDLALPHA